MNSSKGVYMDTTLFEKICRDNLSAQPPKGIGTLGEKRLHAILKSYISPFPDTHEIKIGGYVADIAAEEGLFEIQISQFDRLRKKLAVFLPLCPVTVVYPIAKIKWLLWIDQETGEVSKRRRSPKTGTVFDAFRELYKIKNLMLHPNLSFRFLLLEIEEYRNLNGWDEKKKKGSSREERIPISLLDEFSLRGIKDFAALLPPSLPDKFTSADLSKSAGITLSSAQITLNVLSSMEAVRRSGKQGRSILYEQITDRN